MSAGELLFGGLLAVNAAAFLLCVFFAIRHAMLYFNSACPSSFFCRQLSLFPFGNSSGGLDYIHDYLYNTKDTKSCDEDGLRKRPAERAFGR